MISHIEAVEAAIEAAEGNLTPLHGPLLGLVRALAAQMDQAGDEGPSTRLSAAYLSSLKDFGRAVGTVHVGADPVEEIRARRRLRAVNVGT